MSECVHTIRQPNEGRTRERSSATTEIEDSRHPRDADARRCEVVLQDGYRIRVRAASPEDLEPLRRMFARLSPRSMYHRFLSPFRSVPEWALGHAVHVDHQARESYVAMSGGEIIGQAMYVRSEGENEAEVAVVVEDAWQRRGIGTLLLLELAAIAERRGIEAFTGTVLHENSSMLGLAATVRAQQRYSVQDGLHLIRVPLRARDRRASDAMDASDHRGGAAMDTRLREFRSRSSARGGVR